MNISTVIVRLNSAVFKLLTLRWELTALPPTDHPARGKGSLQLRCRSFGLRCLTMFDRVLAKFLTRHYVKTVNNFYETPVNSRIVAVAQNIYSHRPESREYSDRRRLSVCLYAARQHNSKTNYIKLFKLGIGNE